MTTTHVLLPARPLSGKCVHGRKASQVVQGTDNSFTVLIQKSATPQCIGSQRKSSETIVTSLVL